MAGNVPAITEKDPTRIVQAIRDLFQGRSNAVGTVTLVEDDTTTTVTALNVGAGSRVFLMPITANASADFASGGLYISSVGQGTFEITHPNTSDTDKTFFWVALG